MRRLRKRALYVIWNGDFLHSRGTCVWRDHEKVPAVQVSCCGRMRAKPPAEVAA